MNQKTNSGGKKLTFSFKNCGKRVGFVMTWEHILDNMASRKSLQGVLDLMEVLYKPLDIIHRII